jgi:hypothetical protein
MPIISNDRDLRDVLNGLTDIQQRIIGASFAKSVIHLSRNEWVRRSVEIAQNPDASDAELQDALKAAKGYAAKTYTDCGKDTDWLAQADHFVAASAAAALTSTEQLAQKTNPAWAAAVHARMAKDCEAMDEDEGEIETEAQRQYRIVNDSL